MMTTITTGIVALDARRGFGRRARPAGFAPRAEDTRVHRLMTQAGDMAARYAMLLRESDHRIKNSLQLVASILQMQARRTKSETAADAMVAAAAQVMAIGQMHGALQYSAGDGVVRLGALLSNACRGLHAMAGESRIISIVVADESIEAPAALAQPLLLAVNELVINALRHAFTGDREGAIKVSLQQSGENLCVVVADDGRGLPVGGEAAEGYGMKVVRAMVSQIGGTLACENKAGARFTITAPLRPATTGDGDLMQV